MGGDDHNFGMYVCGGSGDGIRCECCYAGMCALCKMTGTVDVRWRTLRGNWCCRIRIPSYERSRYSWWCRWVAGSCDRHSTGTTRVHEAHIPSTCIYNVQPSRLKRSRADGITVATSPITTSAGVLRQITADGERPDSRVADRVTTFDSRNSALR